MTLSRIFRVRYAQLLQQWEKKKVHLVLVDGTRDDPDSPMNILSRCQHSNTEVTGIGL